MLNRSSTRLPDTGGVGFVQESIKESAMTTEATTTTTGIQLTDVAAAKVSALLAQEGRDDLNLRVAVQPGGCSGLKYQLYFDDRNMDGDIVREFGAV